MKLSILVGAAAFAIGIVVSVFWLLQGGEQAQGPVPAVVAEAEPALAQLRQLEDLPYPVYWLGEEYEGLKLHSVQQRRDVGRPEIGVPPTEMVTLIYTSCIYDYRIPPEEGGCGEARPKFVQVQSFRFCQRRPSFLAEGAKDGEEFSLRGATAQRLDSGMLRLYFGESTVAVGSSGLGDAATENAARQLRGANALGRSRAPEPGSTLGPPMREEDCGDLFELSPLATPTATVTATAEREATSTPIVVETPTPQ